MRASLIIAAHNEGDSLWKTVQSCIETSAGLDCEIVIADDASWDGSVEEVQRRFPQVRIVRRPGPDAGKPLLGSTSLGQASEQQPQRKGTSPTKDFGARSARGEVLVFLDGHCKPEPGALARLVEDVEHLNGRAIVTPTIPALDERRWRRVPGQIGHGYSLDLKDFHCDWLPLSQLRNVQEGARRFYESPAAIGCALAVHRELYEALWGFDSHMRSWGAEDLDFSLKCWLMGFRILHDPEAVVAHRFQRRFDRYDVPLEHFVVNQLRMARKNFTQGIWADWIERCQKRHGVPLADHPEGLWARIWMLFEEDRLSVEQERVYLLGHRTRDEFWYAGRFGLAWPWLSGPGTVADDASVPAEEPDEFTTLAVSPSPEPEPKPEPDPAPPECEDNPECCQCQEQCSAGPIRYFNGEVQLAVTDLTAGGFGKPWAHRRVYSNQLSSNTDMGNGYNWLVQEWPYAIEHADGSIAVVRGTRGSLWFDLVSGTYIGRYGAKSTLTHDTINGLFVLTLPGGERYTLHDYDQTTYPAGLLASHESQGGQVTQVTSYAAAGQIEEIQRSVTVGTTTTTEAFRYTYTAAGQTDSVTLRRQVNAGAWSDIRRVLYEYYGDAESYGSLGDLKRARTQVPQGTTWADREIHYYRYYKSGETAGFAHGLKYEVRPKAYQQMTVDGLDPLTATGAQVAQYADHYFEYNADRRVTKEAVDGGSAVYTFSYATSSHANAYNNWTRRTVENRPDGSQHIVYTNYIGQVLVKQKTALGITGYGWIESRKYHLDGRLMERAHPSAITGYNDLYADLNVSLKTSDGLIEIYFWTTAGDLRQVSLKQGTDDSPRLQRQLEYISHSAGGITIYLVSRERGVNGDIFDTSYSYTFHSGTVQVQERTTTLPAVPTSQNGSGVSDTRTERFDQYGYPTWTRDERGFITRLQYDLATGGLVQRIEDVDTAQTSDEPVGWSTPSGGGLHLVTDYELDELGRVTQQLGPEHTIDIGGVATNVRRATWIVYADAAHEQRTGQGYYDVSAAAYTLVNPVSITKRDAADNVLEQIQAVRSITAGRLTASDTFTQSDYSSWTTYGYTHCCLLAWQRVYHTIPGTGEGVAGTNYDETQFGYDSMKRRNRTVSPGGTIRFDVFDIRDQVVSSYVGTDDTGATEKNPTGGGAIGNDMVLLTSYEYDGGLVGGDGNLTKETQHVDATTTRVTSYLYDWRNRRIATDGELDFYQQVGNDDQDRPTSVVRFDTTASGNRLAQESTYYDDRGRVYRTIRDGVDPATGTITGDQTQDFIYDEAGNLVRQEPVGSMEYQTFAYDSLGRRTAETDPLGHSRSFAYDAASNMISMTDQNQEVWTRGYDALGRLVRSTNPLGESTTYGYNDAGEQTTVTNGMGETTTTTYDDAGRRIAVSDPLSKVTSYAYDAHGNQTSVTDPNNLTTLAEYDYLDRLVKVTDPANHTTEYAYNRAGELLVETDAKSQDTTHQYDALGRRISTTDRLNQTTTFSWNALGLQESITDAENQTTSYIYDDYGRLYRTIWPDHMAGSSPGDAGYGITQIEYDQLNRVRRTTDQLGDTVTHWYDAAGRMQLRDYRVKANSPSGAIAARDTFSYDDASRMLTAVSDRYSNTVTYTYDAAGRKSTEALSISGQTYTSTTQYDAAGRVSKLIYPDASEVNRTYTARGQLHTLAVGLTTIDTRAYDDGGRLTSSSYNNGVSEARTYNNDNTVASISFSGASIGDYSYGWDANKNKTSESISGALSGYGFSVGASGYDAEDRLVNWQRSDTNLDQSWNLSPVGDWNSITENTSTQNRTHGPAHELLTAASQSVQHDPKGNMTQIPAVLRPGSDPLTMEWDFENKLVAADSNNDGVNDVFYTWDALGRRVGRDDGTDNTVYVQDGQQTIADYPAGAASGNPTYTYVYASYMDEPVLRTAASGARLYYHRNQQYSITAVTGTTGAIQERYAYTAYGAPTILDSAGSTVLSSSAYGNRIMYTGREWDAELALYHFRARMYDPVAGRFVSRDPIGYVDGASLYLNYQSLHRTDSTGRSLDCDSDDDGEPDCPQRPGPFTHYGCFCGEGTDLAGEEPAPIDPLDNMCQKHDSCYGSVDPPCKNTERKAFGVTIGVNFDPRPECAACDEDFCHGLNSSRCNRYGVGTPEYSTCEGYINIAHAAFQCQARFGL